MNYSKPRIDKTDRELLMEIHEMLTDLIAEKARSFLIAKKDLAYPIVDAIGSDKCGIDMPHNKQ